MKTAIAQLERQIAALKAFERQFQPDERMSTIVVSDPDEPKPKPPTVTFYAEGDYEWALGAFGATGWQLGWTRRDGSIVVRRYVCGVRVQLYGVAPELITALDGGLSLAPKAAALEVSR